jgi:hypothetical protein
MLGVWLGVLTSRSGLLKPEQCGGIAFLGWVLASLAGVSQPAFLHPITGSEWAFHLKERHQSLLGWWKLD